MAGTVLRGLALLGALGGATGQILPPPAPPGFCRDTIDDPRNPNFNKLTKCCMDSASKGNSPLVYMKGCGEGAFTDSGCTSGCGGIATIGGGIHECCTPECCTAPTPRGHGKCPDFTGFAGTFPQVDGIEECVDVVQFALAWEPGDMQDELELWLEGLSLTLVHINGQGGMRLGRGKVGWANLTAHELTSEHASRPPDIGNFYKALCGDKDVDVLIAPLKPDRALRVARALEESSCTKPLLAAVDDDEIFEVGYSNLWSPYKRHTAWVQEHFDFLYSLGARRFVIVGPGQADQRGKLTDNPTRTMTALMAAIQDKRDARLVHHCSGTETSLGDCWDSVPLDSAEEDVFIGLEDGTGCSRNYVTSFGLHYYAPKAAVYLREADRLCDQSNFDQIAWEAEMWMGNVPWRAELPYSGPTGARNPYANQNHTFVSDFERYLGDPQTFQRIAQQRLGRDRVTGGDREVTYYHAKAAATILMLQMAVEQAGDGGLGLDFEADPDNPGHPGWNNDELRHAMLSMDAETFWGRMKMNETGSNTGFTMGLFQYQEYLPDWFGFRAPIVGPQVLLTGRSPVIYPAAWNCRLTDTCWKVEDTALMAIGGVLVLLLAGLLYTRCRRKRRRRNNVLRESLLGGPEFMPDAQLAKIDVTARWHEAADRQAGVEARKSVESSPSVSSYSSRVLKTDSTHSRRQIMFTDGNLAELQPTDWQEPEHVVGKGSFGHVYRARWRGQEVAVKKLELPDEPKAGGAEARDELERRVQQISKDFVTEVEVCCDLAHPNLVRLMGYATKEGLMLVQELMLGQALDKQLYVERWKPSEFQIKKVATDVALGMQYLHTAFQDSSGNSKPIIHRDLKSPNLLLARPPGIGPAGEVTVKISDFGLSREKDMTQDMATMMMTGCGSVLWMAPEILLGKKYNEKVDVFSYAMCLVEMIDCTLPWAGTATSAEVPNRVTKNRRPENQLRKATDQMESLISRCWQENWRQRPSFDEIVEELTGERPAWAAARVSTVDEGDEEDEEERGEEWMRRSAAQGLEQELEQARVRQAQLEEELASARLSGSTREPEPEPEPDPAAQGVSRPASPSRAAGGSVEGVVEARGEDRMRTSAAEVMQELEQARTRQAQLEKEVAALRAQGQGASGPEPAELDTQAQAAQHPKLPSRLVSMVLDLDVSRSSGINQLCWLLVLIGMLLLLPALPLLIWGLDTTRGFDRDNMAQHEMACLAWSALSCFVPSIVVWLVFSFLREDIRERNDSHVLHGLAPEDQEKHSYAGCLGFIGFIWGALSIVRQVLFLINIYQTQQYSVQFASLLTSLLSTLVTSLPLAFGILDEISAAQRGEHAFGRELTKGHVKMVIAFSCFRIESLSVLRLKLCRGDDDGDGGCNCLRWRFPMHPKHFFFIQSIGAYHLLLTDIPHLLVAYSEVQSSDEYAGSSGGSELQMTFEWMVEMAPRITMFTCGFNMVWTCVDLLLRFMQWVATSNRIPGRQRYVAGGIAHRFSTLRWRREPRRAEMAPQPPVTGSE